MVCSSKLDPLTRTGFISALNSTGILTLIVHERVTMELKFFHVPNFLYTIKQC